MSTRKQNSTTINLHIIIVVILITFSWFSLNEANHLFEQRKQKLLNECNIFKGHWAWDSSYPMYDPSNCPEIRGEFDCLRFGRPDLYYLMFRWQPDECDIPRFDGVDFLTRMRGKKIMFVGDSLSLNNYYQSLVCLLHAAVPNSNITQAPHGVKTWIFQDYDVSITMYSSLYLVDIDNEQIGRVMKLNSVDHGGKIWKEVDVLVFNTWLWWYLRGPKQPWDYIQEGNLIQKDMDRMVAFEKALRTWAKWVDSEIDPNKTTIFFQGINPTHYNGKEWNETGVIGCSNETMPMKGSTYPSGEPAALKVVKQVLNTMSKPVYLLDITTLSQLRKDGHPSSYNAFGEMDCNHWCVAGVSDTWNQLLYTTLLM